MDTPTPPPGHRYAGTDPFGKHIFEPTAGVMYLPENLPEAADQGQTVDALNEMVEALNKPIGQGQMIVGMMSPPTVYTDPGPQTPPQPAPDPWARSREAEARAKLKAGEVRLLALRFLTNAEWTDPELYAHASEKYAVSPSGLRTRRAELVSLGLVQSVGTRDNCTTWKATEAGTSLTFHPDRARLLDDMWQAFRDRPDSFPSATDLLREIVSMHRAGFSIDHLIDQAEELLR